MNEKVKALSEKLDRGLDDLINSERYAEYLKMQAMFHHYSWSNAMLIMLQRPTATKVAGIGVWNKLGRRVNAGEHGIMIFAPNTMKRKKKDSEDEETVVVGFRAAYVFDKEQTSGEPLAEIAQELRQNIANFDNLSAAIYDIAPCPISLAEIAGGANGRYLIDEKRIEIQQGMSEAHTIKTMLHETAHAMLHADSDKDRETMECEAESVAYIVSSYLGIDTSEYSFGYIAGWADKEIFKKSLADIQKCADSIIEGINKKLLTIKIN